MKGLVMDIKLLNPTTEKLFRRFLKEYIQGTNIVKFIEEDLKYFNDHYLFWDMVKELKGFDYINFDLIDGKIANFIITNKGLNYFFIKESNERITNKEIKVYFISGLISLFVSILTIIISKLL